jgi:hypothetical protein
VIKNYSILVFFVVLFVLGCDKSESSPNKTQEINAELAGLKSDTLWNPPTNAIHIDPANGADSEADGSIEHPFSSISKIVWKDGIVIAFKRGASFDIQSIVIQYNNIILASYGNGERPVINSTTKEHVITTDWQGGQTDIIVRDIEINAPNAVSCIIFRDNNSRVKILNCKLHGSIWGIRALNYVKYLYVYNTEVYNIFDDGMFIKNSENIEIANCYVHHVNQYWKPPSTPESIAGGDGIQFENCNHWRVHHNKIDRSDTGNKFCFISNNPNQNDGVFEYNFLTGPLDCHSIYLGDGENLIVRYNHTVAPSLSPVYSHSKNLKIYNNIFEGNTGPLYASVSAEVYNNLFYNMPALALQGGTLIVRNNIFDLKSDNFDKSKVKLLTEDHNLFVKGNASSTSFNGDPKYKSVNTSDFHIQAGSDCIDKAVNVGILEDFDGIKIPQGNSPDIGPFEFKP